MSQKAFSNFTGVLVLACILVTAIGCSGSAAQAIQSEPTPQQIYSEPLVLLDELGDVEVPARDLREPTPHSYGSSLSLHFGAATASLEERIYMADVVVKARLISAVESLLAFEAVTYLKGSGPTAFTVQANTENRDTQWDDQDAILFLKELASGPENFVFVDTTEWDYMWPGATPTEYTGDLPSGYTLGRNNPVWIPVSSVPRPSISPGVGGQSQTSPPDSGLIEITANLDVGGPVSVTQQDLEQTIRWMAGPSSQIQDQSRIVAYQECVVASLETIRYARDKEAYLGREYAPGTGRPITLESSQGQNTELIDFSQKVGQDYILFEVIGPQAHLFSSSFVDPDGASITGYEHKIVTARPLPAGEYELRTSARPPWLEDCKFRHPDFYVANHITVKAPLNTIHEAFFDPAVTARGVGYAADAGVLDSSSLKTGAITELVWHSGRVYLTVNPGDALAQSRLDFIGLDGSVVFSLDPDTASSTNSMLTWSVPTAPWAADDKLMLRIVSDLPPPILDAQMVSGNLSSNEPGFLAGMTGSLTPNNFQFQGSDVGIMVFYWGGGHLRLLLGNHADLSGHVLVVLDSQDTEILQVPINNSHAIIPGSNWRWDVPTQPWNKGDTLRLIIRPAR